MFRALSSFVALCAWSLALAAPPMVQPPGGGGVPVGGGGVGGGLPGSGGGGGGGALPPSAGGPGAPAVHPTVTLNLTPYPVHGEVITDGHNQYDSGGPSLWVGGRVHDLANPAGWRVAVQGQPVGAGLAVGPSGDVTFSTEISLAENQGSSVPYSEWLDDHNRPLIGVLAELIDPNGVVVDRERAVFYDARGEPDMRPKAPRGLEVPGVAAQVSPTGLTALAEVHERNLYFPSSADFHGDLDDAVDVLWPTSAAFGERCDELGAGHPALGTEAYDAAYAEALALFGFYESLKVADDACSLVAPAGPVGLILAAACKGGVAIVKADMCVKELPTADDFRVCTSALTLEATDATAGSVSDLTLAFGAGDSLVSRPVLYDLEASYVAELDDLRIRWHDDSCDLIPSARFTSDDLALDDVTAWRTCDDLAIRADSAEPTVAGLTYDLALAGEELDVTWRTGSFSALPDEYDVGDQTCGQPWVESATDTALKGRVGDLAAIVTWAWADASPANDESVALDLLLSPLEVGLEQPRLFRPDVTWTQSWTDSVDGLWMIADTDATPAGGSGPEPFAWFLFEDDPPQPLEEGLDPDLQPFDVAYFVTTGFLNQTIRASYGTGRLYDANLRITRGDMGANSNQSAPVQLDGPLLATRVHPLFAEIGNRRVTLRIDGTFTPFTLMERDVPFVDPGQYKVAYNAPAFEVTLASGPDVWARFVVDVHQGDLSPTWQTDTQTVAFRLGSPATSWMPVEWNFTTCASAPVALGMPTCETDATGALAAIATPAILRLLQALIGEVPAPRFFDADGTSPLRLDVEANATGTWQSDQVITILTVLE